MKDYNSQPLAKALDGFIAGEPAYFCIPGHRFERGIPEGIRKRFGSDIFKYDLTEANGLDDLHNASGAIAKSQVLAAKLYGAQRTWFLVNGTTCGNEALLLAAAHPGDEVIAARNVHQSVVSGFVLSGAKPVWIVPQTDKNFGFSTSVTPQSLKETLRAHRNAKAVFIVSPTYYGVNSDISELARICHENGIPLIVDEAHGAHFYFNENFPAGALKCGADAVVMSTHKTLCSMTQSSMLHLNSELIDPERIEAALKITMSSSPSYILMTSLEGAVSQMQEKGYEIMDTALKLSMKLRENLAEINGIDLFGGCDLSGLLKNRTDPSRVVFSAPSLGISGHELSDRLFDEFGIALEMADMVCCVAVVTGANSESDINRLSDALRNISKSHRTIRNISGSHRMIRNISGSHNTGGNVSGLCDVQPSEEHGGESGRFLIPEAALTPRDAFFAEHEKVPIEDAEGRISAQSIAPYPPGIPVVNPGEIIDRNVIETIMRCRKNGIRMHSDQGGDFTYIKAVKNVL